MEAVPAHHHQYVDALWKLSCEWIEYGYPEKALRCLMTLRHPQNAISLHHPDISCKMWMKIDCYIAKSFMLILTTHKKNEGDPRMNKDRLNQYNKTARMFLVQALAAKNKEPLRQETHPDWIHWELELARVQDYFARDHREHLEIVLNAYVWIHEEEEKQGDQLTSVLTPFKAYFRSRILCLVFDQPIMSVVRQISASTKLTRDLNLDLIARLVSLRRTLCEEADSHGLYEASTDRTLVALEQLSQHQVSDCTKGLKNVEGGKCHVDYSAEAQIVQCHVLVVLIEWKLRSGNWTTAEEWNHKLRQALESVPVSDENRRISWSWLSRASMAYFQSLTQLRLQAHFHPISSHLEMSEPVQILSQMPGRDFSANSWLLFPAFQCIYRVFQALIVQCRYSQAVDLLTQISSSCQTDDSIIMYYHLACANVLQRLGHPAKVIEHLEAVVHMISNIENENLQLYVWLEMIHITTGPSAPPLQERTSDGAQQYHVRFQSLHVHPDLRAFAETKLWTQTHLCTLARSHPNVLLRTEYLLTCAHTQCTTIDRPNLISLAELKEGLVLTTTTLRCQHMTARGLMIMARELIQVDSDSDQMQQAEEVLEQALKMALYWKDMVLQLEVLHTIYHYQKRIHDGSASQGLLVAKWQKRALSLHRRIYRAHQNPHTSQLYHRPNDECHA